MGEFIAAVVIALLVGLMWGYEAAHVTVSRECERLGGFYVNDQTYRCERADGQ